MNVYKQWLEACLEVGLPGIGIDTAARLMAILYEYGNNEGFTYNQRFLADMDYIQQRFSLYGTGVVDHSFHVSLRAYIKELQDFYEQHKDGEKITDRVPEWVPRLLKERYEMKFIG